MEGVDGGGREARPSLQKGPRASLNSLNCGRRGVTHVARSERPLRKPNGPDDCLGPEALVNSERNAAVRLSRPPSVPAGQLPRRSRRLPRRLPASHLASSQLQ